MDSRAKNGLVDLWWFLFCVSITITIICTSMLAGRRLSTEKNTETCNWIPSSSSSSSPRMPQLVDQVVLVIIDALTPRVALGPAHALRKRRQYKKDQEHHQEGETSSSFINPHVSRSDYVPRESGWFTHIRDELERPAQQSLALGFFSVADAPTTTAQRTKAMVTGTIPVLLEAGASFNSFSVEEDNLLEKLGGGVAVLGDDTWVRLFPEQYHWASANVFESFDVRDLHTVDNGILEHLNAVLRNTEQPAASAPDGARRGGELPRLVISHFLGVDHAGHQYHARDPHLFGKVSQLNTVLRNVSQFFRERAETPAASAGGENDADQEQVREEEGGVSTLLLVMGDHGMTDSGDHGGSTPSETDTFLFSQVFPAARRSKSSNSDTFSASKEQKQQSEERILSPGEILDIARWFTKRVRRQHCATSRLCRITDPAEIHKYCRRAQCASALDGKDELGEGNDDAGKAETPLTAIHQIDLVPTLAAIFGLPIPKQNLGRLAPEIVMQALVSFCNDQRQKNHDGQWWRCTTNHLFDALEKLMKCNVEQLQKAFCSEFQPDGKVAAELCGGEKGKERSSDGAEKSSSSSSSSAKNIDEDEEEQVSSIERLQKSISDLDALASRFTRLAREALTDVDVAAVLIALTLGFLSGFFCIWTFMFTAPSSAIRRLGSFSQVRDVVVSSKKTMLALAVFAAVLRFCLGDYHCKSDIALFVALPLLFLTWVCLDGQHWLMQAFEMFPLPRVSRRFFNTGASLAFLIFAVRIGVQMSNSFIVREDAISCTMVVSLLAVGQHLQLQIKVAHGGDASSSSASTTTTRVLRAFFPVAVLGSICAASLHLGRRVRDFDSHFVEAHSRMQFLQRHVMESVFFSEGGGSSSAGVVQARNLEEFLAQRGQSNVVAAFVFLRWLFLESCFIHVLLFGVFGVVLLVGLASRVLLLNSSTSGWRNRSAIRAFCWRAIFVVGFIWNCAVSNATSLQAFLCQAVFLLLWAKWFPMRRMSCRSGRLPLGQKQHEHDETAFQRRVYHVSNCVDALLLHLSAWAFFFASGSQCVFSTIDWNMAFVGVSNVNLVAGGALILVHTLRPFLVNILVAICIDQYQRRAWRWWWWWWDSTAADSDKGEGSDDENEKKKDGDASSIGIASTLIYINAVLVLTMCYSMVRHRGHLMSWEVFFPRFAFEVGTFVLSILGACVVQILTPR